VVALLAILVAPATASRVGGSPADIWLAAAAAIASAAYQVLRLVRYFPLTVLLCVVLPAALPSGPPRVNGRWFGLVSVMVAITLPFCYFPSFYAQNGNPPARSLIVPGTILIGYLLFAGFAGFAGYSLQRRLQAIPAQARILAAVALAIVQIAIAATSLPEQAVAAQQAAARWDVTDHLIRASRDAGQMDITIAPLPPYLGEDFVTSDRQHFLNVCVARYYGVRSIAASTDTLTK
jgi:hypothetical protein